MKQVLYYTIIYTYIHFLNFWVLDLPLCPIFYGKKRSYMYEFNTILNYFNSDFHCKPSLLRPAIHGGSRYSKELEHLRKRLHFPEEVAIMLTNVEHGLFNSILPAHYIRQVTTDLTRGSNVNRKNSSVEDLIQRFNEVCLYYIIFFKEVDLEEGT